MMLPKPVDCFTAGTDAHPHGVTFPVRQKINVNKRLMPEFSGSNPPLNPGAFDALELSFQDFPCRLFCIPMGGQPQIHSLGGIGEVHE